MKVNEYLEVGVTAVVVLDPEPRTATLSSDRHRSSSDRTTI